MNLLLMPQRVLMADSSQLDCSNVIKIYSIYIMFRTTKTTNSHYFAFPSLKSKGAITDHSHNSFCSLDGWDRRYPGQWLRIVDAENTSIDTKGLF